MMTEDSNRVLKELILGIIFFGLAVTLTGIWWVDDKKRFFLGLVIGIVLSIWKALHIQFTLTRVLDYEEKAAQTKMTLSYVVRTLAVIIVLGLLVVWDMGTIPILMCFVGLFGLKAGAMLQPHIHKYMNKLTCKCKQD
ncbi:MAG: hypothetical protein K2M46_09375 [Lachnospiraceae bacterium]|nr:hypothetical protein [Lachnospiraceae bacterium]